ncbi:hypothetical protein BH23VER1_BH23VER1_31920 [soil metagenome]
MSPVRFPHFQALGALAAATLWLAIPAAAADLPGLDAGNADALHALMKPKPDESAWLQIPWRADLATARADAAAAGKPVYLWEMDGHPLGCT